jgi:hypothetical protein
MRSRTEILPVVLLSIFVVGFAAGGPAKKPGQAETGISVLLEHRTQRQPAKAGGFYVYATESRIAAKAG